ncbi:MAG: threonine synthase [Oscillospiraceae bacterium]
MFFTSTRDKSVSVTSAQAITMGISKDGGLFVPREFPKISASDIESISKLDYIGKAKRVLSLYLTDFTQEELDKCVNGAYAKGKFSSDAIAPLVSLDDNTSILELWKGPTCAFKDMALQLLPYLLTTASSKVAPDKEIVILVATSGDTGKAALEGFKDVEGTKILVFYPVDGVSEMQKLQMTTQEGKNVSVCAINGNFDDAQTGVKAIFTNNEIAKRLEQSGMMFSSANSINWGRLVPQIVYYVSAYCDMITQGTIKNGELMNVVVPTGNFGNILAAYYAKKMGLPIGKLICASNANNVLTDFLTTGRYDRNRAFHTTTSPSMDILISSNLERLIFDLCGKDDKKLNQWMSELAAEGVYDVGDEMINEIRELFCAGFCDDEGTKDSIKQIFEKFNYLCDTHTAVAVNVCNQYREKSGDKTPVVIASTASPFKFSNSVLAALESFQSNSDGFAVAERLAELTSTQIPQQLSALKSKKVRFTQVCDKNEMEQQVFDMLRI